MKLKSILSLIVPLLALFSHTETLYSQTGAQLRFLQMERSIIKWQIPVAKKKVPSRDEWYMEYMTLQDLVDEVDIPVFSADLSYDVKTGTDVPLLINSGTDVILREGSGIYLDRISSSVLEISDITSHYTQLSGVNAIPGIYEHVQTLPIATNTKMDFNTLQDNGFSTSGSTSTDEITIDVTGIYRISFATTIRITPANLQLELYLEVNNVRQAACYRLLDHPTLESLNASFNTIASLTAGDVIHIELRYSHVSGTPTSIDMAMSLPSLAVQRIK